MTKMIMRQVKEIEIGAEHYRRSMDYFRYGDRLENALKFLRDSIPLVGTPQQGLLRKAADHLDRLIQAWSDSLDRDLPPDYRDCLRDPVRRDLSRQHCDMGPFLTFSLALCQIINRCHDEQVSAHLTVLCEQVNDILCDWRLRGVLIDGTN